MKATIEVRYLLLFTCLVFFNSCSLFEKTSKHGFESGIYSYKSQDGHDNRVYLEMEDDSVTAFQVSGNSPVGDPLFGLSLLSPPQSDLYPEKFIKKSLDIDITSIVFKFRPGVKGLPVQFTTDFNAAMYAGWRRDNYLLRKSSPLIHKRSMEVTGRGFDAGIFAGPGTTLIAPFVTQGKVVNEYNGMILQFGIACFVESSVASFGIAGGVDHLLSPDRSIWIYQHKPWLGFIVGIALN
jgi:hypothetical protein